MLKRVPKLLVTVGIMVVMLLAWVSIVNYRLASPPKKAVEPRKSLTIRHVNSYIPLDATATIWNRVKWDTVHLFPQSARSPHGTSEKELRVKAVLDDKEVAFLVQFDDGTEDRNPPANPDACAILFAPEHSRATVQMMGYGGKANVWQWLADRDTEKFQRGNKTINTVRELIASGPGTQTPLEKQNVEGKGTYRDGKWFVVFKRSLKSNQEGEFDFEPGLNQNIAFALWNGSMMESFSRKSISILRTLILEER